MKIAMTGKPGTHCHSIAVKLAERLSMDCITAKSCFPSCCFDNSGKLLQNVRLHKDKSVDNFVNDFLQNEIKREHENVLLCSYNATSLLPNAVKILLTYDIQSSVANAANYPFYLADLRASKAGSFSESNYDLIVNVDGIDTRDILNVLINSLVSGKYYKYVPVRSLLPTVVEELDIVPGFNNMPINVYSYKGCRFIQPESMRTAFSYARYGFSLAPVIEQEVSCFECLDYDKYEYYFKLINTDITEALHYLNFALYMLTSGYRDEEKIFYSLCKDGDPYIFIERPFGSMV